MQIIFFSIVILQIFYAPLYAYSQTFPSESESGMILVANMTNVKKDLPFPPDQFSWLLFGAFIIIITITVVVFLLIRQKVRGPNGLSKIKFSDFVRDGDYYPSLPRFQFLVWTFVISFVYLSIYLIRILSGEFEAPSVDNNLLILLGISIISPLLSNIISGYKYTRHVNENGTSVTEGSDVNRKSLKSMLFENNKPALFRYQMFLWTFIGITIFITLFAAGIYEYIIRYQGCLLINECISVEALAMPKIDNMLVTLMGLSQSGYLGGKVVARTPARITEVAVGLNNKLIIFGQNFGERDEISSGTVLVNEIVVAGHSQTEVNWFDTKIEFPIEEQILTQPFRLKVVIDDVIFLDYEYIPKSA